jgi:hypothetical protein
MKNIVKMYTGLKDQKKEDQANNNKQLHLKRDQMLDKVQTVIKKQHPVLDKVQTVIKEQHPVLDKIQTVIKEQHLVLDKILTVIKQQNLASLIVIKISQKLLIPPVKKFQQVEVKIFIGSKDQKREDQAKILPLPKKVQTKVQDKVQDQDKQQDQFRLQTITKEADNLQDSQQVDKIVLKLLKPHKQAQVEVVEKRSIDFQDLKREKRVNKEILHLDLSEILIIQIHQLQKVIIKVLKKLRVQLLHLQVGDQIREGQLLDQEKENINLERDLKKVMGVNNKVLPKTTEMEIKTKEVQV